MSRLHWFELCRASTSCSAARSGGSRTSGQRTRKCTSSEASRACPDYNKLQTRRALLLLPSHQQACGYRRVLVPTSVIVTLTPETARALRELALRELRDPRLQARWLLEDGLRRGGVLRQESQQP